MHRTLTAAALLLALFGVVTGNLLRPCQCDAADLPDLCSSCCRSDGGPDRPSKDDDGCRICCKPRPAAVLADPTPTLPAPSVACVALAWIEFVAPSRVLLHEDLGAPHARRGIDPWLYSPAGLAVFLI